jgi:CheY-like chemotaxis protein
MPGHLSHFRDGKSYDKAAVQAAVRSCHLWVVDDNEVNRDVLSRRLRQQGYPVGEAEDGRRALEYAKTHRVARGSRKEGFLWIEGAFISAVANSVLARWLL